MNIFVKINNVMKMENKQDKGIIKNAYKELSEAHTLAERVIAGISE